LPDVEIPHGHGDPAHDHTTDCDSKAPAGTVDVVEVVVGGTVVGTAVVVGTTVVVGATEVVGAGGSGAVNVYQNGSSSSTLSTSPADRPDTVKVSPAVATATTRCDPASSCPAYTEAWPAVIVSCSPLATSAGR
jgi:hypothetical protein